MTLQMYMLTAISLTIFSCRLADKPYENISLQQSLELIHNTPSLQIVDLRTNEEIQQTGRIEGAVHFDFYQSDFEARIHSLDKNKPVLLYCAAGSRSSKAASILVNTGFEKVYNFKGGMNAWKGAGQPTIP
ncbi:MAG: rhodanese-like domain-containing protein [Saprospiraceae bacterium]|nr:rhodanese-like domain-containing protein [Saprospiraceae bacterium]